MVRTIGWCVLFFAVLSVGCGRSTTEPKPAKPDVFTIGISMAQIDEPWKAQMLADMKAEAAKHPDLKLDIRQANNDAAKQQADLADFCKERVRLIIVRPVEAMAITEPVAKAFELGIPVVVLERALLGNKFTTLIASDPKQIGTAVGRWLNQRLGGKGNLVEIKGPSDSLWAQELRDAWRAAMRDPGYHFIFDGSVDPPRTDAGKMMTEVLGHFEKIDAVIAYDDTAAEAAYQAAKKVGREKSILFVGVGGLPSQGEVYVRNGSLSATFLNPTGGMEAIEVARKLIRGESVPQKIAPSTRVTEGK
jgi:ribose transport system substrate-binding protein